jgi:hypothetical protein
VPSLIVVAAAAAQISSVLDGSIVSVSVPHGAKKGWL